MNVTAPGALGRQTRLALVLLGVLAVAGAIFMGLYLMVLFGTIFAHNSTPRPELVTASRAAFIAPALLLLIGISSLASVKRKHLIFVGGLAAALLVDVVVAKWLYEVGTGADDVYAHPVVAELPSAPLVGQPAPSGHDIIDRDTENGVAATSVSTAPVDSAPVTTAPISMEPGAQ